MSTSKKVRTLQEEAAFYLSHINEKDGRCWWESMSREKMKRKMFGWLKSENVMPGTKEKVLAIIETL